VTTTVLLLIGFTCTWLAVITAMRLLDTTRWHYCPRCRHYHNNIGERTPLPWHGQVTGRVFPCRNCYRNLEDTR